MGFLDGLLDRILRRGGGAGDVGLKAEGAIDPAECRHLNLSPKWQDAADLGKEDLAYTFECPVCGASLTPDEARALRAAN